MLDPKNPQFKYLREEDPYGRMHDPKNPQFKDLREVNPYEMNA
jgi:hypothetical protein